MRQMPVSAIGLSDAAIIKPKDGKEPFIVVSMYGGWQGPHPYSGKGWIYPDASIHRIISDLSTFVRTYEAHEPDHRIIAAGDLNISFDYEFGYHGSLRPVPRRLWIAWPRWACATWDPSTQTGVRPIRNLNV